MLFKTSAIIALAVAPYAFAQNEAIQLQSIIAQFKNAKLTPEPLPTFSPTALLGVTYGSAQLTLESPRLSMVESVKPEPKLTLTPVTTSPDVTASGTYTVAMIDADYVGASQAEGQTRHWLVNGVKATGTSAPWTLDTSAGTNITAYAHYLRCSGYSCRQLSIEKFDFEAYVKSAGLGSIVAGSYITVEQGTATQSVEPTSSVDTATLSAPSSSTSGSSAATGSRTATGTAPASTSTNAAWVASLSGECGAAVLLGAIALKLTDFWF
ncbi:hypothetical protein RhiXN_02240 [Rhizoctonia solani]|uniref:Uncharacterized protein n=1 Tax=Rhizoctonia solani TaxID=456999 RepID=A0A8H8PAP2_9AGAM|nr:uncharacterized protein RhiXN_02240 [Rhizoctonia solani]QRW27645.1 hypothetical protein RhiXN_02240 [Rhizoctonia solani]